MFINPKKPSVDQLENILEAHSSAIRQSHAAILLFTDPFTKEQRRSIDTKALRRVDLRAGFDRTLRDTVKMVRKATMPCWDGMDRMKANCFNDGWFLIDMETTGINPLEDDVVSLRTWQITRSEKRKLFTSNKRTLYRLRADVQFTEYYNEWIGGHSLWLYAF